MALKRKAKIGIILGSIGSFLLTSFLVFVTVVLVFSSFWTSIYFSKTNIDTRNWMSKIDGETYINEIIMPGSHDSATRFCDVPLFTRTQQYSIKDQLQLGTRLFDLRLNYNGGKIKLVHSSFTCKENMSKTLYFRKVIDDTFDFLDKNSTETVVFLIKNEGDSKDNENLVNGFLNITDKKEARYWYFLNVIPKLKEVRGKIVFLSRFGDGLGPMVDWSDQGYKKSENDIAYKYVDNDNFGLFVQDAYKYSVNDKWDAFLSKIPTKEKPTYVLDYLSTTTGSLTSPFFVAPKLNKKFMSLDINEIPKAWLFFDFISVGINERIIQANGINE